MAEPLFSPTIDPWLEPGAILGVALVIGALLEWLMRSRVRAWASKTAWRGDDVLVETVRGMPQLACLLFGVSIAATSAPLTDQVRHVALSVVSVGFIILVTVIVMRLCARGIASQAGVLASLGSATIYTNVVRAIVLGIGMLVAFQHLGIPIAPMLTALGVGGLAVALALQPTLSNLFSGIQILATRKIQPGHLVRLASGEEGTVVDISWRETSLKSLSGNLVLIPNAMLASAVVTNYTLPVQDIAVVAHFGVAYGSDLELVERVSREVASAVQTTHPDAFEGFQPVVLITALGGSSIDLIAVMRAKEFTGQGALKHAFFKQLVAAFASAGISIPFPTQEVILRRSPAAAEPREAPPPAVPEASA
ncbi:MAG: mechanosensitive ion channel family protein [Planctomycetes bacterium]|nr:mechanosensitive ion channel family protein [Planctomycetota bacterium]